jgi:hypothetical protein
MTRYTITMEITVADTDAPPSDWMPVSIESLMEDGETIDYFVCEEIKEAKHKTDCPAVDGFACHCEEL